MPAGVRAVPDARPTSGGPSAGADTSPTTGWSPSISAIRVRPDRHAADEVLGAVDRVDHPLPVARPGRRRRHAELLAEHAVARAGAGQRRAERLLHRGVRVGDRGQVGLRLDVQVEGPEPGHRDRVGGVGEQVGERRDRRRTGPCRQPSRSPDASPSTRSPGPAVAPGRGSPSPAREASSRRYDASRRGSALPAATQASSPQSRVVGGVLAVRRAVDGRLDQVGEAVQQAVGARRGPGRSCGRPGCRRSSRGRPSAVPGQAQRHRAGRRVPALADRADHADRPVRVRHQPVDQRGLAHAGVADQDRDPAGQRARAARRGRRSGRHSTYGRSSSA